MNNKLEINYKILEACSLLGEPSNGKLLKTILNGHNGFIAGGCFKDFYHNKRPKDIDIFFRNKQDYEHALVYFINHYQLLASTENADKFTNGVYVYDLVHYTYGEPEEILSNFDFEVCKVCLYKDRNNEKLKIIYGNQTINDIKSKELNVKGKIVEPDITLKRMVRYLGYGYTISSDGITKVAKAINNMDKIEQINLSSEDYEEA